MPRISSHTSRVATFAVTCIALLAALWGLAGGPVLAETATMDWAQALQATVPVLQHPRGQRWPLMLWRQGGHAPRSGAEIRLFLDRGLVPHIRLTPEQIPAARALMAAGAPVIALETRGGLWPYDLAGATADSLIPGDLEGWRLATDDLRQRLARFRQAGIVIDAFWLDLEGGPHAADPARLRADPRRQRGLPAAVLEHPRRLREHLRQLWIQLLSAHVAAPIREFYPDASVTNWVVTLSSRQRPVRDWLGRSHPPLGPTLFTATTPLAYGVDTAYLHRWPAGQEPTPAAVDRFFLHLLLEQVSANQWNLQRQAPHLQAIPWVARRVVEHPDHPTPAMGRPAFREALRHLWLRGVDAMQIFNPPEMVGDQTALDQVADAVAVLDELLAHRDFLDRGTPLTLDHPGPTEATPLWSGLELDGRCLIRIFLPPGVPAPADLPLPDGHRLSLPPLSPGGTTLVLDRRT
ncbi:MAG: hypothetical protein HQL82_00155 [Magnetococcales bacterium]|nr:hypothetical protein [Magnetococcales bacterium]